MKSVAIKVLKILIIALLTGVVSIYAYFYYIDKKNDSFLQGWTEDNKIKYLKQGWTRDFNSRINESNHHKLTSSLSKTPVLLSINGAPHDPSSISVTWLYRKDKSIFTGVEVYFPSDCSPGSILESNQKYGNGDIITLKCEENGKWISTRAGLPVKAQIIKIFDLLGFYERVYIPSKEMKLLRQKYALYSSIKKESNSLLGYSQESRANNALTCSGLFWILTSIPNPEGFNASVTNAAILMRQAYIHLDLKDSNNGEISRAKEKRALELADLYDKNQDDLVDIYAQCNEIRRNVAQYVVSKSAGRGDLTWSERKDMYSTSPSAKKIDEIDSHKFNVYKSQIDLAMANWKKTNRMTNTDFKNTLLDSLKKKNK